MEKGAPSVDSTSSDERPMAHTNVQSNVQFSPDTLQRIASWEQRKSRHKKDEEKPVEEAKPQVQFAANTKAAPRGNFDYPYYSGYTGPGPALLGQRRESAPGVGDQLYGERPGHVAVPEGMTFSPYPPVPRSIIRRSETSNSEGNLDDIPKKRQRYWSMLLDDTASESEIELQQLELACGRSQQVVQVDAQNDAGQTQQAEPQAEPQAQAADQDLEAQNGKSRKRKRDMLKCCTII